MRQWSFILMLGFAVTLPLTTYAAGETTEPPKGWLDQMAAIDIARFMPFHLYSECKYRRVEYKEGILDYHKQINSSAMLLNAFAKLGSGAPQEFTGQLSSLKSANSANCRLGDSWEKFLTLNSKKDCEKWVEEYEKLYEEYVIRINALIPVDVLSKRDAALVTVPLNHAAMFSDTKAKLCPKFKNK